jgi:hypothetical protein
MTRPIETTIETGARQRSFRGGHQPPDPERDRLQLLVGELLSENQRLRFENEGLRAKLTHVEQEAQRADHALTEAVKWAGMLF